MRRRFVPDYSKLQYMADLLEPRGFRWVPTYHEVPLINEHELHHAAEQTDPCPEADNFDESELKDLAPGVHPERMLKHFSFEHLPDDLARVSSRFARCALDIVNDRNIPSGPERTVALRKLLEAKDCAVRAKLFPGG